MPQTLEYPWNGVAVVGPLPAGSVPAYLGDPVRNIQRIRVLLDPRVVMPLTGTVPLPNLTSITIFGGPPNAAQSSHAREITQICSDTLTLGDATRRRRAAVLSLACALVETGIQIYANPNVPNSSIPPHDQTSDGSNGLSVGIFQQQVGPGFQKSNSLADVTEVMSVSGGTALWLQRLTAQANWWVDSGNTAAGNLIQAAQQSNAATLYAAQMPNAEALVTEIGFPPTQPSSVTAGTIPANIQTAILEIANGARTATAFPMDSQIEWCLDAAQWPTSATAGRRPRVADLTTFWGAMNTLVGAHAATWGFSLLNNPTFTATSAANQDPHASMTAYANVTWSGGTDPTLADHQTACRWLETLTAQVRSALRTAGFTKVIAVPTMYSAGHLKNIAAFHPNGPWINDSSVYYETSFFPAALDETQIKSTYAVYNTWAGSLSTAYRTSWNESAYYTSPTGGGTSVIDPEVLAIPPQEALPADPNAAPVPVLAAPVITSVVPGPASLQVNWTPPPAPPGGPILGYTLTLTSTEPTRLVNVNIPTATQQTVLNLTNDVVYTVSVAAFNVSGTSAPSSTLATTPTANAAPIDAPVTPPPVTPTPPVITVEEPNTFAFYPVGVNDSQGVFSPSNWAGL